MQDAEMRDLVERARGGDRQAFDSIARKLRRPLLTFVRKRLGPNLRGETEAEDIVQETLLKAFKSLDRFQWKGAGSTFSWFATIAEYVIRGVARSSKRLGEVELDWDPPGSGPSPSRLLRREERAQRLEAALQSLSLDHRRVIRLVRIEGLQIAEIAKRMDRSPGAVRHLLLRALEKLRAHFGEETRSLGLPEKFPEASEGERDV